MNKKIYIQSKFKFLSYLFLSYCQTQRQTYNFQLIQSPRCTISTEKTDPHGKFKRVKRVMLHKFKVSIQTKKVRLLKNLVFGFRIVIVEKVKGVDGGTSDGLRIVIFFFFFFFFGHVLMKVVLLLVQNLLHQSSRHRFGPFNWTTFKGDGERSNFRKKKIDYYCSVKLNREKERKNSNWKWKKKTTSVLLSSLMSCVVCLSHLCKSRKWAHNTNWPNFSLVGLMGFLQCEPIFIPKLTFFFFVIFLSKIISMVKVHKLCHHLCSANKKLYF